MKYSSPAHVKRAEITHSDEITVVKAFSDAIDQDDMAGVIFFCSADYDLKKLGKAMQEQFSCPVIGCTSAGEIGSKYQQGGIVGASFSAASFRMHSKTIKPLDRFSDGIAQQMASELETSLEFSESLNSERMFGLLLIDGLSLLEEQTIAYLHHSMMTTPIIGGSAGDSLRFRETKVYAEGQFHSGAAVFALIETTLPFRTFKLQHFVPSDRDMVITESDPARRIVYEIDGEPAAKAYAKIVNLKAKELTPQIFSTYPVMLQIGDEWYMRSIEKVNKDGSLSFFCAIDNGLPLTIGKGIGFIETLRDQVKQIRDEFPNIEITLGFDCILRRLEMLETNKKDTTENLLNEINFLGFSTYGEQFNAIHVNQTLTGVVIGGKG